MKKIFQSAICVLLIFALLSAVTTAYAKSNFRDVKSKAWYAPAVAYANDHKYMNGVGNGAFSPDARVSRAMFATVLYRLSGEKFIARKPSFSDNRQDKWFFEGIEYCAEKGIVNGYGNGTFGVSDLLTRQDMMTMLYRYARTAGHAKGETKTDHLVSYFDHTLVSSYAKKAINWCLDMGVADGVSYTNISPKTFATRAQLAQILMNFGERVMEEDVSAYRKNSTNPHGIALQNVRLHQKVFSFRLSRLPDGQKYQVRVQYKLGGKVYSQQTLSVSDPRSFRYNGDAAVLYSSADVNMGRKMSATVDVTVLQKGQVLFQKTLYFGEFFQNASNNVPLFYKGQATMDSRILLYHEFTLTPPKFELYGVISTPEKFEDDLRTILERGYTVIPLEALIEYHNGTRALPQKSVILTFDDGYTSNYTLIYPILKKYNVPATIFVTVSTVGGYNKMNWAQMREMEQSGLVNIQSHSWKHEEHAFLPAPQVRQYVSSSYALLEENLGQRPARLFAYPHGSYSDQTVEIVRGHNVALQVTTDWRALDMDRLDLSRLPRVNASYELSIDFLLRVSK